MRFCTQKYERSHCRKPRGWGVWAFAIEGIATPVFTPSMRFGEARTWIKTTFPGCRFAEVMP
jgi:hypothetical protein